MRHRNTRRLKLIASILILIGALPFSRKAQAAPAFSRKLAPHLRIMQGSSRDKLRSLRGLFDLDAEAAVPTVEVTLRLKPGFHRRVLEQSHSGILFRSETAGVVTARVPITRLAELEGNLAVDRIEPSHRLKPSLDVVKSVALSGGLNLGILENANDLSSADGSGVVIGIIDSGIDYTHPDFKDSLNNTRILAIWDQTSAGSPPAGFGYGNECSQASINAATCTQQDTNGHGSNVAGIAGGNGRAGGLNKYLGMAKGANFIIVRSNLSDGVIIDGMNYIVAKAQSLGKRAVINMSFGGQSGAHDGTDNLETAIAAVAASTPIAIAMGNDNADSPHASFSVPAGGSARAAGWLRNRPTAMSAISRPCPASARGNNLR